jgi:O-6-methylguanine DNA methyltransferase
MQKKILQYLQQIPPGKVVTYGQIAAHLGNPRLARAVGNALHRNPDGDRFPCYKVVSAQGKLSNSYAFGGLEAQKRRLQADGIVVTDDRLDLSKYQWNES